MLLSMNNLIILQLIIVYVKRYSCYAPSFGPTVKPAGATTKPSIKASFRPTKAPSNAPMVNPSYQPSNRPTFVKPSYAPSLQASVIPSYQPSSQPSRKPSEQPSSCPTGQPSVCPTMPTGQPSTRPSDSHKPSAKPTTRQPTVSFHPSVKPTISPSTRPTRNPSYRPTLSPISSPTTAPTRPTAKPSECPTSQPSSQPSSRPNVPYTMKPTINPSILPTSKPSIIPTRRPTAQPIVSPTTRPTYKPTPKPSIRLRQPTSQPSSQPSRTPSRQPTSRPTGSPTFTHAPSKRPTGQPSSGPTIQLTDQPTSRPSGQPSRGPTQPTSQPSHRPSRQPTGQPSEDPSCHPTCFPSSQPSTQPSSQPSNPTNQPSSTPTLHTVVPTPVPTPITKAPTCRPSTAQPTGQPSSRPTLMPTLTYCPTSRPTIATTRSPTVKPTYEWGETSTPTAFFETVTVSGSVQFDPDSSATCVPVQITMWIVFDRNISHGTSFTMDTPGLTRGFCYNTTKGAGLSSLLIPNTDIFTGSYSEGSYADNFDGSKMTFLVASSTGLRAAKQYQIVIDRGNRIRKSCSMHDHWDIKMMPYNTLKNFATGRIKGYMSVIESFPKKCFVYSSAIHFTNPQQQFLTGINITLRLGYEVGVNTILKISLPGFTNKKGAYGLNVMTDGGNDFAGNGVNAALTGIETNTNFTWLVDWHQGDYSDNFKSSYLTLHPLGYHGFTALMWVYIPKSLNSIIPICGHSMNSADFTISSISSYFYTNTTPIDSSNAIGAGCLNQCNGNGICDFCSNTCSCFDNFGSSLDKSRTVSQDFAPDCSSRACPVGPSMGSIVTYRDVVGDQSLHMHKHMECSSNGICDRSTGSCKCSTGYTGLACEKMMCPGTPTVCSGKGKCLSMGRLASTSNALPLTTRAFKYYSTNTTNTWDEDLGHMCVCDSGWPVGLQSNQTQLAEWFGVACQLRRCPSGDDPVTTTIDETDCEGKSQTGSSSRYNAAGLGQRGNLCHIDCSNRGVCDYSSGLCKCVDGFWGPNCGRRIGNY